jgi:hypothetical protein
MASQTDHSWRCQAIYHPVTESGGKAREIPDAAKTALAAA